MEVVDVEGETEDEMGDGLFRLASGSIIVGKDGSC